MTSAEAIEAAELRILKNAPMGGDSLALNGGGTVPQSERIYQELKEAILSGEIAQHCASQNELGPYDVNRSPVRMPCGVWSRKVWSAVPRGRHIWTLSVQRCH